MKDERLSKLEKAIEEAIAGVTLEITVRGEKKFTFSFDGQNQKAVEKLEKAFKGLTTEWESDYDAECDQTAIWFTVN
jgi:hypothetical protein